MKRFLEKRGLWLLLAIAVFGVYGEGFDPRDFVYFNF